MLSINLQFQILLYQAMSVAATSEACIVLPHTRNSAAVEIKLSSAVYFIYYSIFSLVNYIFNYLDKLLIQRPCWLVYYSLYIYTYIYITNMLLK